MTDFERIQDVLGKVLEVEPLSVRADAVREDFEKWDSLGQLTLVMELEAAFDKRLTLDEATSIDSVSRIVELFAGG